MYYPPFHLFLLTFLLIFASPAIADGPSQLLPHVPHFVDKHHLGHLNHSKQAHIYFREHSRRDVGGAIHASLNLTFHHQTVILDHSIHTTETCTANELTIEFFSHEAFIHAQEAWSTEDKIVFITSKEICVQYNTDSLHTYFSTTDLTFDDDTNVVKARGSFMTLTDIASHGRIIWGQLSKGASVHATVNATPRTTSTLDYASLGRRADTSVDSPAPTALCSAVTCNVTGTTLTPLVNTTIGTATSLGVINPRAKNVTACSDLCLNNSKCLSFGYNVTSGECQLLTKSLSAVGIVASSKGNVYYDRDCFQSDCISSTTLASAGSSSTTIKPYQSSSSIQSSSLSPNTTSSPATTSGFAYFTPSIIPTSACLPPAPTISGLPAVAYCSNDFDKRLDAAIGLFDLDSEDVDLMQIFERIAPGIAADPNNYGTFANLTEFDSTLTRRELFRQHLEKRRWKIFSSIARAVSSVAHKVASAVAKVATVIANDIKIAALAYVKAVKFVVTAILEFKFKPRAHFHVDAGWILPQKDDSPWGKAFLIHEFKPKGTNAVTEKALQIKKLMELESAAASVQEFNVANPIMDFKLGKRGATSVATLLPSAGANLLPDKDDDKNVSKISIYCVNCGLRAYFDAAGEIDFSLAEGISAGQLRFEGELLAQLQVGIHAMYLYKKKTDKINLVRIPLAGWEIPHLIAIGPQLTVGVQASWEVKAEGQLLAGYALSMADAITIIDIVDHRKSTSSGWTPTTKKTFSVHGELSVGFALELPIEIGVGISLLKWDRTVGLVDTPSLNYDASIVADFDYNVTTRADSTKQVITTPKGDIWGDSKCPGMALELDLRNRLEVDVFGLKYIDLGLAKFTKTLTSTCVTIWEKPTSTPVVPPTAGYKYMDCYIDNIPRSLPYFPITTRATKETCEVACAGYLYYGLEYGGQCFCGNSAFPGNAKASSCNYQCQADVEQMCGGFWRIGIWSYHDPDYFTRATATGLQYWAWLKYAPQDDTGYYVDIPTLANARDWKYTGVVDNVNVFQTIPGYPYSIQLPGQTTSDIADKITVNLQGYFVPKMDGVYTFTPKTYDNKLLIWTGPEAHTRYGWTNAVINQWGYQEASMPTTLIVEAGQFIPITIVWINWAGSGEFSIEITDPSGKKTTDTSGLFMHDPNSALNDGLRDTYVKKRSAPSLAVTPSTATITAPPEAPTLNRPPRRQVTTGVSVTSSAVPSTTTMTGFDSDGNEGFVSGALPIVYDLPAGVDLVLNSSSFELVSEGTSLQNVTEDIMSVAEWNAAHNNSFSAPLSNSTVPELSYANIIDITGTLQLHTGNDSNLYLVPADPTDAAGLYSGYSNVYAGDSQGNVFVYYTDEYAALNVSRFRAVSPDAIPQTAQIVSLAPFPTDLGYLYEVMDTVENVMFLAFCNIEGSPSKLFLVKSLETGLEILTRPQLAHIVTGGVVTGCGPLALAAAGGVGLAL